MDSLQLFYNLNKKCKDEYAIRIFTRCYKNVS